jgi:NADPH:quinone reductase-like Zn-dependent oxidoreductase
MTATGANDTKTPGSAAPAPGLPTMRAVVQRVYGSADVLGVAEIPRPTPGAGEVLVEVRAAGLDRGVWHLMTGRPYVIRLMGYGLTAPRTPVPGMDLAGRVAAVGEGVTRFAVGDEVFGIGRGSYAPYAVAPESKLAHKPVGLPWAEAAVLPVSGVAAQQAVHDVARVEPGQRVLVLGASGGVGGYAVQLARAAGAHVTGVARAAKADYVRELGAERVLDYRTDDATAEGVRYDVIIDTGGLTPVRRLRRVLAPTGTLVIVGGEGGGNWTGGVGRQLRAMVRSAFTRQRLTTFVSTEDHAAIQRLAGQIEAGGLRAAGVCRYSLEDTPRAIEDLVAGRVVGKAAIVVAAEAA